MPLTDFVRHLNAQRPLAGSALRSTTPFVSENGRVSVHFAKLRLESRFSPIVDAASGALRGHAASLHAVGLLSQRALEPDAVFVLPGDDEEFIYLDRLVRTLHALNYLTYLNRRSRGTLLLRVHPRHVASVGAGHGLAFEEILRGCGLLPEQVTLEIDVSGAEDVAHLAQAIASYKARGYGIAVSRLGRRADWREREFRLLCEIRPDIVKFDPLLLASEPSLMHWIERLRALGAQAMVEGLDTSALRRSARERGFDLVQAHAPPHVQPGAAAPFIRTGCP